MNKFQFNLTSIKKTLKTFSNEHNKRNEDKHCLSLFYIENKINYDEDIDNKKTKKINDNSIIESIKIFKNNIWLKKEIHFTDYFGYKTYVKLYKFFLVTKNENKLKEFIIDFDYEIHSENPEMVAFFFYLSTQHHNNKENFLINLIQEKDIFINPFFKNDYNYFKTLYEIGKNSKQKLTKILQEEVDNFSYNTKENTEKFIKKGFFNFSINKNSFLKFTTEPTNKNSLIDEYRLFFKNDFLIKGDSFLTNIYLKVIDNNWHIKKMTFKNKKTSKYIYIENNHSKGFKKKLNCQKYNLQIKFKEKSFELKNIINLNNTTGEFLIDDKFNSNIVGFRFPEKFKEFNLSEKILFDEKKGFYLKLPKSKLSKDNKILYEKIKKNISPENERLIYFMLSTKNKNAFKKTNNIINQFVNNWENEINDDIINLITINYQEIAIIKDFYCWAEKCVIDYFDYFKNNIKIKDWDTLLKESKNIFTY